MRRNIAVIYLLFKKIYSNIPRLKKNDYIDFHIMFRFPHKNI